MTHNAGFLFTLHFSKSYLPQERNLDRCDWNLIYVKLFRLGHNVATQYYFDSLVFVTGNVRQQQSEVK